MFIELRIPFTSTSLIYSTVRFFENNPNSICWCFLCLLTSLWHLKGILMPIWKSFYLLYVHLHIKIISCKILLFLYVCKQAFYLSLECNLVPRAIFKQTLFHLPLRRKDALVTRLSRVRKSQKMESVVCEVGGVLILLIFMWRRIFR